MIAHLRFWASVAAQFVVLAPVFPFYWLSVLGPWIERQSERTRKWKWAQACVAAAHRIERWERRAPPPIQGVRVVRDAHDGFEGNINFGDRGL